MSLASDRRLSGSASVVDGAIFLGRDIYSDEEVVGAVRSGATDKLSRAVYRNEDRRIDLEKG